MKITIYHNDSCGNSKNALAAIRAAGHEPTIVEYLKTPLTRDALAALIAQTGQSVRDIARKKEKLFAELGLDERDVGDAELLDAMVKNPVLINRPIVVVETPAGATARLCRPSELVKLMLAETADLQ